VPDTVKLVFGTASLGMAYGLPPSQGGAEPLDEPAAVHLVRAALGAGIDTFDTAPAYGLAEERLGRSLGSAGQVWTKTGGTIGAGLTDEVVRSLERSLERLRRPKVELLQWHNWTAELATSTDFNNCWARLQSDPRATALGASTYGARDALAAVRSGLFRVVQVEWNLLNQGVVDAIRDEAGRRGVAIAIRSVLLQGALTEDSRLVPELPRLRQALDSARSLAHAASMPLQDLALRGALNLDGVAHILVGFDHPTQLVHVVQLARLPRWENSITRMIHGLSIWPDPAVDPRTWSTLTP
jgi:1-deoxyxylulose-5-phosphate synthase